MCRVCKAGGYVELTEKDILFWNEEIIQRVQDYGVCIYMYIYLIQRNMNI